MYIFSAGDGSGYPSTIVGKFFGSLTAISGTLFILFCKSIVLQNFNESYKLLVDKENKKKKALKLIKMTKTKSNKKEPDDEEEMMETLDQRKLEVDFDVSARHGIIFGMENDILMDTFEVE